jgi:[CysO sulfur-carrier protein]-S-L-cysteine hydrolase
MRVDIDKHVIKRWKKALANARNKEIGGMLFAEQIKPGYFKVIDISIDEIAGTVASFRRDPKKHQSAVDEFFDKNGKDYTRFNYLGEWHSHPTYQVSPSDIDLLTMEELVNDEDSNIEFAVLIIVRLRYFVFLNYSITVFSRKGSPDSLP